MSTLDVRYQVFVSSTYRDLQDERQQVIQALLELDAIPAGMELFPAADDDQWTLIKKVIEDSDYYVIVIGGRYGSTTDEGISYTEKEFDYALSLGKPILAFLHKNPDEIKSGNTDQDAALREKLSAFRKKVETGRTCRYWTSPEDLGGLVSRSLVKTIKDKPAEGWIRGRNAATSDMLAQVNALRTENDRLKAEIDEGRTSPPGDAGNYVGGTDKIEVVGKYEFRDKDYDLFEQTWTAEPSWDEIFSTVGPLMYKECIEARMRSAIAQRMLETHVDLKKRTPRNISFDEDIFQTIKIQLLALGLIARSDRKRTASSTGTYWKLTPYGETYLMKLRAIRKDDPFK